MKSLPVCRALRGGHTTPHVACCCAVKRANCPLHLTALILQSIPAMAQVDMALNALIRPLDFARSPSTFEAGDEVPRPSMADSWISDDGSDREGTITGDSHGGALRPATDPACIPLPVSPTPSPTPSSSTPPGTASIVTANAGLPLGSTQTLHASKYSSNTTETSTSIPLTITCSDLQTILEHEESSPANPAAGGGPAFFVR